MELTESLAQEINNFDLLAEKAKSEAVYNEGKRQYFNIKLHAKFIMPVYLADIDKYLNENGKKVYKKYFQKHFETELLKPKKK